MRVAREKRFSPVTRPQHAVRGDPVEAGGGAALEVEGARARRQRAARRRGRDGHGAVEGARQAVGAVVDRPGDRRVREQPLLRGRAVGLVEPHRVALRRVGAADVEGQTGGGRDRVSRPEGRDAPQLGGGAVRLGQHRRPAGLGQQHAARGDPVEAGGGVALERQRARARRQGAARGGGRDAHPRVEGGRDAVGAVPDDLL